MSMSRFENAVHDLGRSGVHKVLKDAGLIIAIRGSGSPEGNITADPGALYVNTDGGASTTLYVKESGVGTNTGWVAK